MSFREIADRVWVARYPWFDVNVTAIGGADGLLVVDTHASTEAAEQVIADVRALGAGAVRAVVNTHEHHDHVLGNHAFRLAFGDVPIHAHEQAAARMVDAVGEARTGTGPADDPRWEELRSTPVVVPDRTFSSAAAIDLGGRLVELVHPGRGHTGGDLVVRVADADVTVAGDLVEEAGPPAYGADSYPLEWPQTLDLVLGMTGPATVVVPGHGASVDRRFVEDQCDDLRAVAETIREAAGQGVPQAELLATATWPYPAEHLTEAVRRGYAHLPLSGRRLPLL